MIFDTIRGDRRFRISQNSERLYQVGTYQRLLADTSFDPEDVIVSVDGDDWLPDPGVLQRVREAYLDGKTWITYGSYARSDGEPVYNAPLEDAAKIRQVAWRTSHLRTWKLWLWRKIDPADMRDRYKAPLRCAGDLAWMFPMIEMAGNHHSKWLPTINYIHNRDNELSCFRLRRPEQQQNEAWLRSLPAYACVAPPAASNPTSRVPAE